jgi:putative Holliday junction resolvase
VPQRYLGIDYGAKRMGVASGDDEVRLAAPLVTLEADKGDWVKQLQQICRDETINHIVIGLPRGLDGQETAQTARVRAEAKRLEEELGLPLSLQDEALTSEAARERLAEQGQPTTGGIIDRTAAAIILQDYLDGLS